MQGGIISLSFIPPGGIFQFQSVGLRSFAVMNEKEEESEDGGYESEIVVLFVPVKKRLKTDIKKF